MDRRRIEKNGARCGNVLLAFCWSLDYFPIDRYIVARSGVEVRNGRKDEFREIQDDQDESDNVAGNRTGIPANFLSRLLSVYRGSLRLFTTSPRTTTPRRRFSPLFCFALLVFGPLSTNPSFSSLSDSRRQIFNLRPTLVYDCSDLF